MKNDMLNYIKKYSKKRDENLKYDFMPELLEIIEKPAHIGGKIIIWGIFTLMLIAIMWASLSEIDVVSTSVGTINPTESVITVQVKQDGVINEVLVNNGQYVQKDEILVKMDSSYNNIDIEDLTTQKNLLEEENKIYGMIMNDEDISVIDVSLYEESTRNIINYIIMEEMYYEKSEINEYTDFDNTEQHKLYLLSKIAQNDEKILEINNEIKKAENVVQSKTIKAEKSGYVTNIQEGLVGNVVITGNVIMNIVPKETTMELTCYIENSDIADIKIGKNVNIKLEAYPYSDYVTLKDEITYISECAISTEDIKNVYMVKLSIENDNESIKILPGMTASVEFNLGKKKVINYFLEPITGAMKNLNANT